MFDAEDKTATFVQPKLGAGGVDVLVVPGWDRRQWGTLFSFTTEVTLPAGATLIQQEEPDRTLYFVVAGLLEAAVSYGGQALAPLRRVYLGSVVGEVAFFDGEPRSARVWAVDDSRLLRLEFSAYTRFAASHLQRANELLFALGRLLALRLRHYPVRVADPY
jgi:CRP/FNR family transcriptional regulator, cyclic AMP receptor protein